jgi:two-component system, chemotaxis family, protein-glutamate methylesterase/glutaminase
MSKLRVLVVDDTLTSRQLLVHILNHSGDMEVVGEAGNGEQAVHMAQTIEADLLLMDVVMPRMDGLEATRRIMQSKPLPIVLVSASMDSEETKLAFQAIEAGALSFLPKPRSLDPVHIHQIRTTVRALAGVKVIHHYQRKPAQNNPTRRQNRDKDAAPQIVAIASSTGGPAALAKILQGLPFDFPLPIVIVQHISPDFTGSLVSWLQGNTVLKVKQADAGEYPKAGFVYVAPSNVHLTIQRNGQFAYQTQQGMWRYMPSCDVLFYSVAECYGQRAIGLILTGMGDDGADGLGAMYETGAVTFAQGEASCVVYGMPKEAAARGAVQEILELNEIAEALTSLVRKGEKS